MKLFFQSKINRFLVTLAIAIILCFYGYLFIAFVIVLASFLPYKLSKTSTQEPIENTKELEEKAANQRKTIKTLSIIVAILVLLCACPILLTLWETGGNFSGHRSASGGDWVLVFTWPVLLPLLLGFTIALFYKIVVLTKIQKKKKAYIKAGATLKTPTTSSSTITPLLNAIISGDLALVQTALTDHPEQLNTAYAQNGNTPLHVAALNGYTDIIRLLLAQPGINTTRTNNEGKTALDLANLKGHVEIAQLLEQYH